MHASSQVSPQAWVGGQAGSPTHPPSSQRSPVVQNRPSSQAPVLATLPQVPSPSQTSSVQTLSSSVQGVPAAELPTAIPVGEPAAEEVWAEADFDEDFDEDFDDEPDEDLEQFERDLNRENIESDAEPTDEFDEDEDF